MTAPQSLLVTGSVELQLDTLAERVALRVVELLESGTRVPDFRQPLADFRQPLAGSDIYDRGENIPDPRTTDTSPAGFPVGRNHPYDPTNPEELLS